jgi:tetratricopeptide (TPR) repeat protein
LLVCKGQRIQRIARIARAVDAALEGRGSVVLIEGEAGTGKSRLSADAASRASSSGFLIHATAAPPTDRSTPFLAWRPIVRSLIGVEDAGSGSVADSLGSLDRNLIPRAPLLASILGSTMPETELTAGLDPELRAELAMTLVGDLVRICSETSPRVLVIEDLQWLDPASRDLLIEVARRARAERMIVIVTYRSGSDEDPLAGWPPASLPELRMELGPLSGRAMGAFLRVAMERVFDWRGSSPPTVAKTLIARAEGNAFYLEELLELCKDRGIDPTDEDAVASAELPAGLHRLALARLDTLPQTEQMVLRVASVVGRRFAEPWLAGSYPPLGSVTEVRSQMGEVGRRGLTRLVASRPDREHEFKHAIVHEAAYTTLSDSSRLELHEAVARYVESRYVHDLRPHLGALAYHYGATRNIGKQREYFRLAADAARDAFANESAIRFYERLLPIISDKEAVEVSLLLGEVRQHAGDWQDAEEAFRFAQEAAERIDDERGAVRARSSLGYLLAHGDRVAAARGMLEHAVADAERLDDTGSTMSALEHLGFATWQLADYGASLATCNRLIDVARRAGDRRAESRALEGVGLARWRLGAYEDARDAFERAIDLAEQLDDARGLTHSANDLGGMLAETGDLVGAFAQVTRGLRLAREIGYRHAEAVLVGNAGELYRQHGELDAALRCSLQSLVVTAPMRDWNDIAFRLGNIALTLADMGRLDEADELFGTTIALARDIEDPYLISAFGHYRADAYARAGREAHASSLNLEALRLAREIDAHEIVVRATLLAARLASASGSSMEDVDRQLDELERLDPVPTEVAMLAYERWLVRPADPQRRRRATTAIEEIYRSMPGPENRRRLETLGRSPAPTVDPLPPLDTGDLDTMSLDDAMLSARTLLEERASLAPEPSSSSRGG